MLSKMSWMWKSTYCIITLMWICKITHFIYGDRKQIIGGLGLRGRGWLMEKGTKEIFRWWNVLYLIVVVLTQVYTFVKTRWTLHLKLVDLFYITHTSVKLIFISLFSYCTFPWSPFKAKLKRTVYTLFNSSPLILLRRKDSSQCHLWPPICDSSGQFQVLISWDLSRAWVYLT